MEAEEREPLPCIILNANLRTKTGEAWERVYVFTTISRPQHLAPICYTCYKGHLLGYSFAQGILCASKLQILELCWALIRFIRSIRVKEFRVSEIKVKNFKVKAT